MNINKLQILDRFQVTDKDSFWEERKELIDELAEFTSMKWIVMFGKTKLLTNEEIRDLRHKSKRFSGEVSQRVEFWKLLKKKVENIKRDLVS